MHLSVPPYHVIPRVYYSEGGKILKGQVRLTVVRGPHGTEYGRWYYFHRKTPKEADLSFEFLGVTLHVLNVVRRRRFCGGTHQAWAW